VLDLSDGARGDLPEVAGHGGTRSAEWLDGGGLKGWQREARDRSERGWLSGSPRGVSWLTGGGPEVAVCVARQRLAQRCSGDKRRRRKKDHAAGGAHFIAGGGGWQRRHELRLRRWWPSGDGYGLNVVSTGGAIVQTGRLTGGPQRFWIFFVIYPTLAQI
jgi:hypothetical protein